jgi:cation:H+ antiporter
MLVTVGLLIAGVILLTVGAEFFVRGSSHLATRLGISPLVVGLTVVAFGTSSPELFVSVKSALSGYPGIAVGNVIGSNIANIALILGTSALITPLAAHLQVIRRDTPFMVAISATGFLLLWDKHLSRIEAIGLFALFLSYVVFTVWMSKREKAKETADMEAEYGKRQHIVVTLLLIVGGFGGLVYGSNLLVDAGVVLARFFGVSETIIGISIVAVGTSLPELAASLVAAAKKEADIAIGNVVGSNVFNVGLVLGSAGIISPFSVGELNPVDIGVMLFLSALLIPFLITGLRLNRAEGGILLGSYAVYIYYLWV